jgi:hypothetical protein
MLQPADIDGDDARRFTPLAIFCERASARALLVDGGLLTLQDAVDTLQFAAVRAGLVGQLGQDSIQQILAEAFARSSR